MIASLEKAVPTLITMASWPNMANDLQWVATAFPNLLEKPWLWKFNQMDSSYIYDGEVVGGMMQIAWIYYTKGLIGLYSWIKFIEREEEEDG